MSALRMPIHGGHVQVDQADISLMQVRWYVSPSGHIMRTDRIPGTPARTSHYLTRLIAIRVIGRDLPAGHYARVLNGDLLDLRRENIGISWGKGGACRIIPATDFAKETI